MDEYRDTRLRHHYKERYDYRNNLIDGDFYSNYRDVCKNVKIREYRDWRNKGIGYEIRNATYPNPNRTMSGYVAGNRSTLLLTQKTPVRVARSVAFGET